MVQALIRRVFALAVAYLSQVVVWLADWHLFCTDSARTRSEDSGKTGSASGGKVEALGMATLVNGMVSGIPPSPPWRAIIHVAHQRKLWVRDPRSTSSPRGAA